MPPNLKRDLHGIVLLDKPSGISSNHAMQKVKHLFSAKKAGHGGSLDPLATGLLPVCFGRATRVAAYLLDSRKGYRATCELGIRTTTGDAEGEVIATRAVPDFDRGALEAALKRLTGPIQQIPPMYSALKHKGKRLYELARSGVEVPRPPRDVHIYTLELVRADAQFLTLDVLCSKGTYVRTLIEDLGDDLGCGAHVTELRRTFVAPFESQHMRTLTALESAAAEGDAALLGELLPADSALVAMPRVDVGRAQAKALCHGQITAVDLSAVADSHCRVYGPGGIFLGIGESQTASQLKIYRLLGNPEEIRGLG